MDTEQRAREYFYQNFGYEIGPNRLRTMTEFSDLMNAEYKAEVERLTELFMQIDDLVVADESRAVSRIVAEALKETEQ